MATPELCRKHGVSQQTFYRWKPNVRKGSKLYIEGKLQTSTWEDKQSGERKYRTLAGQRGKTGNARRRI